jgi:ribose 1,5-bisphosphokinase
MSAAGPGTLVLVVGPSGAGKDTLMAIARDLIGPHERVKFPRRIVTRPPTASEDHDSLTAEEFEEAVRNGSFAFWWRAHGLGYGFSHSVDDDIARGITVVCNVSRGVVPDLRHNYAACRVVLVDAPREVRAQRLRARGRGTDGDTNTRLDRRSEPLVADVVIMNTSGALEGGRVLARAIMENRQTTGDALIPAGSRMSRT